MLLSELEQHFFRLYGRRNRLYLSGLRDRIDLLIIGVGDLQHAIRKCPNDKGKIGLALARVVSRTFCVAESFSGKNHRGIPLVRCICGKYPIELCTYCAQRECQCKEDRKPSTPIPDELRNPDVDFSAWTWALRDVYGARNKSRGIENLLNRLFREVSEFISLSYKVQDGTMGLDLIEEEFANELADVLAWTVAIANFFEINLEACVENRYVRNGCWNCKKNPCVCKKVNRQPVVW